MKASEVLHLGELYTRQQLREQFAVGDNAHLNRGIFQPNGYESVWLFVTEKKTPDRTQYEDVLNGDTLYWDGQEEGDTTGSDKKIIEHEQRGLELLLFYRKARRDGRGASIPFRYEGLFRYVSHTGNKPTQFVLQRVKQSDARQEGRRLSFNRWWDNQPGERYWLETTDRDNLGADLNAPQRRDDGEEYYGYSLIREVRDGDVVFHYHKNHKAIVAVSRAAGVVWEDNVVWGAHGTVARNAGVQPYTREGWRLGLDAFQALDTPVTLDDLRSRQDAIQAVRNQLEAAYHKPVYFPFEPPEKRDLRPTQAYITKLPLAVVKLFPALMSAAGQVMVSTETPPRRTPTGQDAVQPLGATYRSADEDLTVSERDPFSIDPTLVERGNRGHAAAQNALAAYLISCGVEPRSPAPDEPNYDLAWTVGDVAYVAEVKSLTDANEEKQLRLGLGQLLRYRHLLGQRHARVQAVLMAEREPTDPTWTALCEELSVQLTWPTRLHSLNLERATAPSGESTDDEIDDEEEREEAANI